MKRKVLCNECHAQFSDSHQECPDCGGQSLSWIRRYDGGEEQEDHIENGRKKRVLTEYDDT